MVTLSYLKFHPLSPFSSLIITTLLSNSKVLLEVGMLEFLELLLVHLGLLVIKVDNALDNLQTAFHVVHRLGEEGGEVVVLDLTEDAIVSGDLQLGALNFKLEFFDFCFEFGKFEIDHGSLAEVDGPLDKGRVWRKVIAVGLIFVLSCTLVAESSAQTI